LVGINSRRQSTPTGITVKDVTLTGSELTIIGFQLAQKHNHRDIGLMFSDSARPIALQLHYLQQAQPGKEVSLH
jgi:hypothetical protein